MYFCFFVKFGVADAWPQGIKVMSTALDQLQQRLVAPCCAMSQGANAPSEQSEISSTADGMFLEDANSSDLDEWQLGRRLTYRQGAAAKLAARGVVVSESEKGSPE